MYVNEISGERQMDFLAGFDFVREAGTEGERKAAEMLRRELESFGAECRVEEFPFSGFRINKAVLKVTEPYQKEYRVAGWGRCGNTPEEGLRAAFLYVENGDDISLSQARDKIVMVNGRVDARLYRRLVSAGAAGFVSVEGTPLDEGEDRIPCRRSLPGRLSGEEQKEYRDRLPGVSIHYRDGVELVTRGASEVLLFTEQEVTVCRSRNVAARIQGRDKRDEILTVTAHYDSVPEGPGAYDNMAGAAVIMELCRYFQKHKPSRTMEFIWFGAEEKGLLGSREYVRAHGEELGAHRFNMNVDLAGQLIGGNVLGITGETAVCEKLLDIAAGSGIGASVKNQIWGSDSNTFAWKGIPAMTLNRDGFGMHTRHDTIDLLSAWSLRRSGILLGCIAEELGNAEVFPFERRVPEKFRRELEEYMCR